MYLAMRRNTKKETPIAIVSPFHCKIIKRIGKYIYIYMNTVFIKTVRYGT